MATMSDARDEEIERLREEVAFYRAAAGVCTRCRCERDLVDPVRFASEQRDRGWVSNVFISFGATGYGRTERAARRSAAEAAMDGLTELIAQAGAGGR